MNNHSLDDMSQSSMMKHTEFSMENLHHIIQTKEFMAYEWEHDHVLAKTVVFHHDQPDLSITMRNRDLDGI